MINQFKFAVAHIIINGLWHPGCDQFQAILFCQFGHFKGCVLGVIAPDIKEIPYIMCPENIYDTGKILLLVVL